MYKKEMCFDNHCLLKTPCKNCQKRGPYCHGDCPAYNEYRKKIEELVYLKEQERRDIAFKFKGKKR